MKGGSDSCYLKRDFTKREEALLHLCEHWIRSLGAVVMEVKPSSYKTSASNKITLKTNTMRLRHDLKL